MPLYRYEARDAQGKPVKGELNSDSQQHAVTELKMKNLFPLKIEEIKGKDNKKGKPLFAPVVKKKHVAVFARQFASMLKAGIPLTVIFNVLIRQERNTTFKAILEEINGDIMKGNTISSAMSKHKVFSPMFLSMVEVGEINGRLDVAMGRVATNMEKEIRLASKVKSAMIYPCILFTITIGAFLLISLVAIPKFVDVFKDMNVQLPPITRGILAFSNFMKSYWYMVLAGLLLLIVLIVAGLKRPKTKRIMDSLKLKIPLLRRIQYTILMARFCRTFSSLVDAGVSVVVAMETVRNVMSNLYIRERFDTIIRDVQAGATISAAISQFDMFTPLVVSMTRIGEESGQLGEVLADTAEMYEEESEAQLKALTSMLEPAVTVIMAIMIGLVVISVVQPMFESYKLIGKNQNG